MRKKIIYLLFFVLFILFGCNNRENDYTIALNQENIELFVGESLEISYTVFMGKKEKDKLVNFDIEDDSIIKLDNNIVTALKIGKTNIKVSLKDNPNITKTISVNVQNSIEIKPIENNTININDEIYLEAIDYLDTNNLGVIWTSSNESIASVKDGLIKALSPGKVTIIATSKVNNMIASIELIIEKIEITSVEIISPKNEIDIFDSLSLTALVSPSKANQDVIWSSSDESIITINQNGEITGKSSGRTIITAISTLDKTKEATITITVIADPIKILNSLNVESPLVQNVTTYGYNPDERYQIVYGSVSKYFNAELNLIEQIIPITENEYQGQIANKDMLKNAESMKLVRSGIIHEETKYITYHDTGNHTPGADANSHARYLVGKDNAENRARSWHYTVDENMVIHHIPDNEVAWQGDSYEAYAKSIGIETCVDYGSDLYTTWQRTAKLMAQLLIEYNLGLDAIKQHYDFNQKECPQTLRKNNLYAHAFELIEAEYLVLKELSKYTIDFTSLNPELVDNRGRVIKLNQTATKVGYVVTIQDKDGYYESIVLYSIIPGLDGSTSITEKGDEKDFIDAYNFDLEVGLLPTNITLQDENKIKNLRNKYNNLNANVKQLITSLEFLENKELALHLLKDRNTSLIINQVLVSSNTILKNGYIELYNNTDKDINLQGWTIQVANGNSSFNLNEESENISWITFNEYHIIKPNSYFLIQLNGLNQIHQPFLPVPDLICNINLLSNTKIAITNEFKVVNNTDDNHVIDFVGFGDVTLFEGRNPNSQLSNDAASIRRSFIDTNDNHEDFIYKEPNPYNSNSKSINYNLTNQELKAMNVDLLILSIPNKVSLDDEELIKQAITQLNLLTEDEKQLVLRESLLIYKELEFEGLKNPDLKIINDTLMFIPNQIVDDFNFPSEQGIIWSYKEGEDSSYFDLNTGQYLKLSIEPKYVTLVASLNETTKEFIINFGVLKEGQKAIFATGAIKPKTGGITSSGNGTFEEQKATSGFNGITITVDNNVYFIGKDAFIPLDKPQNSTTLSIEDLRPLGSSNDSSALYNQALVNGTPTGYRGTGVLYYNNSTETLFFDPSYTYGRNNAGAYGYQKVIFTPNNDETLTVLKAIGDSGTNTNTNGTTISLKPNEYLWAPHTFEVNEDGGTWLYQPGSVLKNGVLLEGAIISISHFKLLD